MRLSRQRKRIHEGGFEWKRRYTKAASPRKRRLSSRHCRGPESVLSFYRPWRKPTGSHNGKIHIREFLPAA